MKHAYYTPARRLALLLVGLLPNWTQAQTPSPAPTWTQAIAITQTTGGGSANSSNTTATATDASGNVYLAGTFRGTVNFGAYSFTSQGPAENVFLAKWSPATSQYLWVETTLINGSVSAMAVSGSSVYVTGYFYNPTVTIGSSTITNANPQAASGFSADIFVAKLTDAGSSGSFVWAQQAGGTGNDYPNSVAASGATVYLTGRFESAAAIFGPTTLVKAAPTNNTDDGFVAKLTDTGSAGSFAWAQRFGGPFNDYANAVAVSGPNVYITGGFNSTTATFGTINLSNTSFDYNTYVARLLDAGTSASFVWAQRVSDGTGDYVTSLAVSGSSLYVGGAFNRATTQIGSTVLTNAGRAFSYDTFVAKFIDIGSGAIATWAQRIGGTQSDELKGLVATGSDLYAIGNFLSPSIDFGPSTLSNSGGSGGYPDIYATKLSDSGPSPRFVWAQQAGGPGNDQCQAFAVHGSTVSLVGFVSTPAYFGSLPFVFPANSLVPFLATLSENTALATATATPLAALRLAPNPAHTATRVQVPPVPGAVQATLTLRDALGRTVLTQQLALAATGTSVEIPVAGLAPGLYRLQVQAGSQRISRALAVE